jgi:structural maintenance of chromosomes protein 5
LVEDLKQADAGAGTAKDRKEKNDHIRRDVDTVKRDIEKLMDDRRAMTTELDETVKPQIISLDRRIKNMENVKQRRLEFLQQNHEDTYKACMWLRQNQDVFHGKVYEPIMMEVFVI